MHTPGPWTLRATDGAIVRLTDQRTIVAPGGAMLADDAALAAAAPDLLDALVAVLPYVNAPIGYAAQAQIAIKKAKGI